METKCFIVFTLIFHLWHNIALNYLNSKIVRIQYSCKNEVNKIMKISEMQNLCEIYNLTCKGYTEKSELRNYIENSGKLNY